MIELRKTIVEMFNLILNFSRSFKIVSRNEIDTHLPFETTSVSLTKDHPWNNNN